MKELTKCYKTGTFEEHAVCVCRLLYMPMCRMHRGQMARVQDQIKQFRFYLWLEQLSCVYASHSHVPLHPGVLIGTDKFKAGDKLSAGLASDLGWGGGGGRNSPSISMLQKSETSDRLMGQ